MELKTKNPAFTKDVWSRQEAAGVSTAEKSTIVSSENAMTIGGTAAKTALLLGITTASAGYSWYVFASSPNPSGTLHTSLIGALIAFILGIVIICKQKTAPLLSPFYAIFEGLALGALSAHYETLYHGIVFNALSLTLATATGMLVLFASKLINPSKEFLSAICAATIGVGLVYLADLLLRFGLGAHVPFIHETGVMGIATSLFIVTIAALNYLIDFSFVRDGVDQRAPKHMEWYGAFGIMVTTIWLYLEILRLLAKISRK